MITESDLGARVGITTPTDAETVELARVLGAVRSKIGATHALPDAPTDDQLSAWEEAQLLAGARLWKRQDTPEGVIGLGAESVIRVGKFDADVDDLLSEFLIWAIA